MRTMRGFARQMVGMGSAYGRERLGTWSRVARGGVNSGSGRGTERLGVGGAAAPDGCGAGVLMIKGGRP